MLQVATRSANKLTSRFRSSRVVLDLCGGSNEGQTRWRKPRKFRQAFLWRKSSHAAVQTRENLKCAFCGHCCGAAFIGGWKFEMSFDQPSCMRCNEHNKEVDFILDWCSCHSGGVLCSERARRRKPQNVSGQSSVALSHRRKLSYARCCCLKPAKTCALFADSLAVPLSYRCSTRSKASVRKLCLLPTVLNDIRLSSRSCFRSFERKILRREWLLL